MKKILFPILALPLFLQAQIVITSGDLPDGPSTYQLSTALTAPEFDANDTGPNHTWDFSDLEAINTTDQSYVSVSSTPFAYQFLFNNPFDPQYQSDHAAPFDGIPSLPGFEITEVFTYYKNTDSDYRLTGMGVSLNGIPLAAKSQPVDKIYQFPLEFGDQTSAYTETSFDVPTLLTYKMKQTRANEVDGWGTITTPGGTFEVLRVKTTLDVTDSIAIEFEGFPINQELPRPQSIEYKWLANGYQVPVLTITQTFGQVTGVRFYSGPLSVSEDVSIPNVILFPNPVANEVMLMGVKLNTPYSLHSADGRLLANDRYTGRIDVKNLGPGPYFLQISGETGTTTHRFIKQ